MRFRIAVLILGLSLLTACDKTTTPLSTQPALSTSTLVPSVLPRPLYYIGPSNTVNQIWRLDIDGQAQNQITHEPVEISNFDISPTDGSIVFVSANKLIKVDAIGGNRVELFNGPAIDRTSGINQINTSIGDVHWSPDGTQIAYALNGINLIAANGSAPTISQAKDPILAMPNANAMPKFYWPRVWSPEGTRILIEISFYPESMDLAIKPIAGGALINLKNPQGFLCCNPTWSLDGNSIFLSHDYPGVIPVGLRNIDATTGQIKTLIDGYDEAGKTFTLTLVSQAEQLSDQRLYYFMAQTNAFPDRRQRPTLSMYSSATDGQTDRIQLRSDSYAIGEALWDPNHTGAVIENLTGQPLAYSITSTQLIWLNVNNAAPIKLPTYGYNLRWGKP